MPSDALFIIGSIIAIVWGIAHIIPTTKVVAGFGPISKENSLIITMEWIAEGITLCFIGILVVIITIMGFSDSYGGLIVIRMAALFFLVMATLTEFTGAKTSIFAIKLCPVVKAAVAIIWFIGSA